MTSEKPLSFQAWCDLLADHCKKEYYESHLPFTIQPANTGYWGMKNMFNSYGQVKIKKFVLDEDSTARALGSCHRSLQTEPLDLLLAVAMHSFSRTFTDRQLPTFYNEGHGRQPWDSSIDLSGTVGWFTSICPLHVDPSSGKPLFNYHLTNMRTHQVQMTLLRHSAKSKIPDARS